jgi:hypothetical protein
MKTNELRVLRCAVFREAIKKWNRVIVQIVHGIDYTGLHTITVTYVKVQTLCNGLWKAYITFFRTRIQLL